MARKHNLDNPDRETVLIEDSYRSLSDGEAFDEMLANWAERFESSPDDLSTNFETPKLAKHLGILTPLLEQYSDAISPDSFKAHIAQAKGPAVLATASGTIVYSNPKAQSEWSMWTGKKGDFNFFAKESLEDWLALCRSASGHGNRMHGILRMENHQEGPQFCIVSVIEPSTGSGRLIKVEKIFFEWRASVSQLLSDTFAITDSEVDICRRLLAFPSVAEIAEARGSSIETVKKQMRSIYAKIGVSGQVELCRLLASLVSRTGPEAPEITLSWDDPLDREQTIVDPQGRRVAFSRMGAIEGRPVILVHGPLTGNVLPHICDELLADAGITLYTLSRPGFGNSDFHDDKPAIATGAEAIGLLADHLGLAQFALAGFVGGLAPAMHYAAHHLARVRAVLSIGSCFPFRNRAERRYLPYHHRVFLDAVRHAPLVSEFLVRHAHRGAKYGGAEFILRRAYRDSKIDLEVLFAPENLPHSFAAVAFVMASGHKAFLHDQDLLSYPWAPLVSKVKVPITTLAGEHDPVFPLSRTKQFAQAYKNWDVVPVSGAGQTIYLSHTGLVCDNLDKIA